jgi:hypothetical protein
MATKTDLFEDIAIALDSWTSTLADATTNSAADLRWTEDPEPYRLLQVVLTSSGADRDTIRRVFAEGLRGFAVSLLTILDGGTSLAEMGRLYVVDEDGQKIGEGLHEELVSHLLDTGRL